MATSKAKTSKGETAKASKAKTTVVKLDKQSLEAFEASMDKASKAKTKPIKGKRAKQLEVPGTERVQDPEIRSAAEDLAEAGEVLTEAHRAREEAASNLIEIMKSKKLKTYVDEKLKLRVDLVSGAEKVKLKRLEEKGSKAA